MSDFHGRLTWVIRANDDQTVCDEVIRITGTKSAIEYKPLPIDDRVRQPDMPRKEISAGNHA